MCNLVVVKLRNLMTMTSGTPNIKIGLIDGPVAVRHNDLDDVKIQEIPGGKGECTHLSSSACSHGRIPNNQKSMVPITNSANILTLSL